MLHREGALGGADGFAVNLLQCEVACDAWEAAHLLVALHCTSFACPSETLRRSGCASRRLAWYYFHCLPSEEGGCSGSAPGRHRLPKSFLSSTNCAARELN